MGKWLSNTIAVSVVVLAVVAVLGVAVFLQSVCVRWYAPWMLGTDDVQAIAYFCSPKGGK